MSAVLSQLRLGTHRDLTLVAPHVHIHALHDVCV